MYTGITSKQNAFISSGSVVYIDFSNTSCYTSGSNIAYDISGRGYSGSLFNAPIYSALNGGSFDFNGTDEFVSISPSADLFTGSIFSVMCWMSPGTLVGGWQMDNAITNGSANQPTAFGPTLTYQGFSNTFSAAIQKSAGSNYVGTVQENNIVTSGSWYHYASVYDGTQTVNSNILKIYINGVLKSLIYDSTAPTLPIYNTTERSAIASGSSVGEHAFYCGKIANVMIYNRALLQSEIIQHYSQSVSTYVRR